MRVIGLPQYLDDKGVDTVAEAMAGWPPEGRLLFDARNTKWASPFGFTALLTAGQGLKELGAEAPGLTVPEQDNVRDYWAKTGFFKYAAEYFELHGKVPRRHPDTESDVLLPVTPIRASEDVHRVVSDIQEAAARILTGQLKLEPQATMRFTMALSEACQNVVEHAGTGGWTSVHAYTWRRRLGRRVVVIAVSDPGIGFRASLGPAEAKQHGDRWDDGKALEAALVHGTSRYRDPGRGQGLAAIKKYVLDWKGKISIRSGTARASFVPSWDDDVPMAEGLAPFPGSQMQIVIPEREGGQSVGRSDGRAGPGRSAA
jgi:anti-sigma regulatory factor (Ser/Thr protein kinase)